MPNLTFQFANVPRFETNIPKQNSLQGKRFLAFKHPFVTGEPFTSSYVPAAETLRMVLGGNRVALHNRAHYQIVPYADPDSYGSLGRHGSYNDGIGAGSSYGSYGDNSWASGIRVRCSKIDLESSQPKLISQPKVINQLRFYAGKKVECGKVQEENPKKKLIFISRPKVRKTLQTTPKALAIRE
ncbi:hypothetical protein LguiA_030671 [Lonicera macranthoides]